jgi:capsular polysaccharide biosynthesis protein
VGAGVAAIALALPPSYQAEAIVQVDIPATDISVLAGVANYVYTQARLASTPSVLSVVAARHAGLSEAQLESELSVTPIYSSQLLQISVRDADATRAAALANEVGETLISQQKEALATNNIRAQQQAQAEIASTSVTINAAAASLAQLQAARAPVDQIAAAQANLASLQKQLAEYELTLNNIQTDQAKHASLMHIAQAAQTGTRVRTYLYINIAAGIGFGLLLGILLVVLLDRFDQRIRGAVALTKLIEWPILAQLDPSVMTNQPHQEDKALRNAYLALATSLEFLAVNRPINTITLLGVLPHDPTSHVAGDFALFLASTRLSTLIMDANLLRPSQHERFDVDAAPGLSNAALKCKTSPAAPDALNQFIYRPGTVDTDLLGVMPAGTIPPNPEQLLLSSAMRNLLASMTQLTSAVVIVDSPAVLESQGSAQVAALTDGAVVVVDVARAQRSALLRASARLQAAGAHVLGFLVIDAESS